MNTKLLEELLALQRRDSDTRSRLLGEERLYGDYAEEMQQVHRENALRLDAIVAAHGWPGIPQVGREGARASWRIAQHAICTPDLQRKFLLLLVGAANRGEVPQRQVALLTDRIRFNEGRPQVFGTVLDWDETGELACEVEDPENLDARRLEVGLAPFQEDLATHRREVKAEGGHCPEDLAAYQRKADDWARRVGWRE